MELKVNIADPKTGKTHKKDFKDEACKPLFGKKLGAVVKGDDLGFPGYEFKVAGGSDAAGFPMRSDVSGPGKKRVLISGGVGLKPKRKGIRVRKTVAGNTIYSKTVQVNLVVSKAGKDPLVPKEEPKAEEAPKEEAAPEKKE